MKKWRMKTGPEINCRSQSAPVQVHRTGDDRREQRAGSTVSEPTVTPTILTPTTVTPNYVLYPNYSILMIFLEGLPREVEALMTDLFII